MLRHFVLATLLALLSGCVNDQANQQRNDGTTVIGPTLTADDVNRTLSGALREAEGRTGSRMDKLTTDLRTDIAASSNSTQSQLSGLVSTSISKVAERMTGVEAQLTAFQGAQLSNTMKLENAMTAVAQLKLALDAQIAVNAELKAQLTASVSAVNTMKADLDAKLSALAGAQVGLGNKLDQTTSDIKSGRDSITNYLPKEAVEMMAERERTYVYLLGGLFGIVSTGLTIMGRNARQRAQLRADDERDERQALVQLLLVTLGADKHVVQTIPRKTNGTAIVPKG